VKDLSSDEAIASAFEAALRRHEAGDVRDADAIYQEILARRPDHAESLHLRGLILVRSGSPEEGAALVARAIRLRPGQAPFHNNLALALRQLGRLEGAAREYRTAIALRPGSAEIRNNLAAVLRDLGRVDEAVANYRLALEVAPGVAEIWSNLASLLGERASGVTDAETCFRRAIALSPDFADAQYNFGRWLAASGRWDEAERSFDAAARLRPEHAASWSNHGIALQELGRTAAAERCYRQAITLDPDCAAFHYNYGCLLATDGRPDEAIASQARALAADPAFGAARLAACMAHLPILYRSETEVAERRARYEAALGALASAEPDPCAERSLADAIGTAQPFFLPYQGEDDRTLQSTYGRLVCGVLARTCPPAPIAPRAMAHERIRVGIVSGYFCDHTIWKLFLEGWLGQLDRNRFELFGFHTGHKSDAMTALAARSCDRFVRDLRTPVALRDAVSAAAPHVLLYPEIGMDPLSAQLAGQRLAAVQCVTWGHPETTGMPTIDCFLSSAMMEPRQGAERYTERLVELPNLGLYYVPEPRAPVSLVRTDLGLPDDLPVYWSGQALYKYLPQYDAVFPRIAARVGACRFVFIAFAKSRTVTAAFRERLAGAFTKFGLDAEQRCVFLDPMPQERFVAAAGLADVVLDTIGWSGGKSTLDLLAVDPAIVTLPGAFMRGRHTAAILQRIGMGDTVAASLDDYVERAAALGRDAALRTEIRARVAGGKAAAFRDLEYIHALEEFLAGALTRAAG
jgi:protein O-GlcNAc transferase